MREKTSLSDASLDLPHSFYIIIKNSLCHMLGNFYFNLNKNIKSKDYHTYNFLTA